MRDVVGGVDGLVRVDGYVHVGEEVRVGCAAVVVTWKDGEEFGYSVVVGGLDAAVEGGFVLVVLRKGNLMPGFDG